MPSPPEWLQQFADAVALQMHPVDLLAPVGCHFCQADDSWEIALFVSGTQIVGGKKDGVVRHSRFNVDVRAVVDLFSDVRSVSWQALPIGGDDELGPHLSIEGSCGGNTVWLRILSRPPKRFDVGRRAVVYDAAWEETW
jgi:hypothetical protein